LNLEVISWLLRSISVFLAIALVVIFQPELRRALTELGSHRFFTTASQERETVEDITDTVFELSSKGFGALIAIERDINLKGFVETGVPIDAKFTKELVLTIFHPKTVLHDGGMVLSGERIVAAACIFPLTQREDLDRNLGLRHRAGLGLGEESDAIILVVSEETGQVSICHAGRIERNLGVEKFRLRLSELLFQEKYESHPAQPLASEADEPDSSSRPVVSHQAGRRPDSGEA
jgi:diadenylate cyclase